MIFDYLFNSIQALLKDLGAFFGSLDLRSVTAMSDAVPYLKHYVSFPAALYFFLLAAGLVFVCLLVFMVYAKLTCGKPCSREAAQRAAGPENSRRVSPDDAAVPDVSPDDAAGTESDAGNSPACTRDTSFGSPACRCFVSLSQRFYELIFSGTSILFFITVYYLIDRFYNYTPVKSYLVKYQSFLLLLLIVLSCLLNSFLDRVFVKLMYLRNEDRASVRIIGMLYMLLIFGYVKYIYENDNYDYFITYFLGLMIGRFVYFDASWKDFTGALKRAMANFPIMLLGLSVTGVLAWAGFVKTDYLIKHIGVITNVFICHLFLCLAVFLLFRLHPECWFFRKK